MFPVAGSNLRSVGGPGGENKLVWFLQADRLWLETVPGKSQRAAPLAAVQQLQGSPRGGSTL